jgi:hypothetical protein
MIRMPVELAIIIATASGSAGQNNIPGELATFASRPASDYTATFRAKLIQTAAARVSSRSISIRTTSGRCIFIT